MTDKLLIDRELLERLLDEGKRSDTWAAQDELRAILAAPQPSAVPEEKE